MKRGKFGLLPCPADHYPAVYRTLCKWIWPLSTPLRCEPRFLASCSERLASAADALFPATDLTPLPMHARGQNNCEVNFWKCGPRPWFQANYGETRFQLYHDRFGSVEEPAARRITNTTNESRVGAGGTDITGLIPTFLTRYSTRLTERSSKKRGLDD